MSAPLTEVQGLKVVAWHGLREMTELLIKHHDLHEGLYDLSIEFQIAIGAVSPDSVSLLPGSMVGVKNIGIVNVTVDGPNTVNAAVVNPRVVAKGVVKKPAKK